MCQSRLPNFSVPPYEMVVEKFREARACSAAFETFIPRRSRSEPEQSRGPGPAWSEDRRRAQKASVATRAPPPPAGRARGYRSRRGRRELREVIQTGVKINTYSPPSGALASPLQFPCNHHLRYPTEVRWEPRLQSDRTYDDFGQVLCHRNCLLMVRTRGLLGGFCGTSLVFRLFWSANPWESDRSLSGGPLHATVGRASIAPLTLEGHL